MKLTILHLLALVALANAALEAISPLKFVEMGFSILFGNCRNLYHQGLRWDDLPRRDDYDDVLFEPSDVLENIRVQNEGPITMQGIFWLKIDGDVPEVVSFDYTDEGGNLGQPLSGTAPRRRQRIMSNRVSCSCDEDEGVYPWFLQAGK